MKNVNTDNKAYFTLSYLIFSLSSEVIITGSWVLNLFLTFSIPLLIDSSMALSLMIDVIDSVFCDTSAENNEKNKLTSCLCAKLEQKGTWQTLD